jgi:uncharacterized protein YdiU (UPF0061 family)
MSILGLTIDYGPYGWLEGYDPGWTPNTTDLPGRRYAYGQQPQVAAWNLARLANALLPLVPDVAVLERALEVYGDTFTASWRRILAEKLGLADLADPGDDALVGDLFEVLQQTETDMTLFFRRLALASATNIEPLRPAFYADTLNEAHRSRLTEWLARYAARVEQDGLPTAQRLATMNRANPKYVLRNYLAQQAIDAANAGDSSLIARLLRVLETPYDEQSEHEDLAQRRPEWARNKAGCSALSCSS